MKRRSRLIIIIIATLAALLPATAAGSQTARGPPCAERAQVVNVLQTYWGEFPIGRGLTSDGQAVEIYAGSGGNWTIIATSAAGISCLVASGEAWESVTLQIAELLGTMCCAVPR